MKRKLCALLLMLLLLSGCAPKAQEALPTLTMTCFAVGKADCILLEADGHYGMIDTGYGKTMDEVLEKLQDKGVQTLDFLLLTHMDKDHIGGVDNLLSSGIAVSAIYAPDYEKDNKAYDEYKAAMDKNNRTATDPRETLTLNFAQGELTLLPAKQESYAESNDYSIMARLTYGKTSFLFAGDAEEARLQEFINDDPQPCDVLKVPHHGVADALSEEFFTLTAPKIAVITCDEKNMPDQFLVDFLKSLGAEVHGTVYGDVVVTSDGQNVQTVS